MDIASAITTATGTLKLVKGLRDLEHELDKSTLKGRMADLYGDLADLKVALSDAQTDLHQRDQKITDLEASLQSRAALKEVGDDTYTVDKTGTPRGLPICIACLATTGKQVRLARFHTNYKTADCPACGATYWDVVKL